MKHYIIIILFISNITVFANDTLTFKYVDSATYSMYQKQEWKELIKLGNEAIYNNIDYFYLRMRVGIAYYETREFEPAISHFEKALEFNSANETAMEYIYYSLAFSGKSRDAGYYAKTLNQTLKDKIKPELPKKIDKLFLEGGYNIIPDFENIKKNIIPPDEKNYRLEKDVTGKFIFAGFGLNHECNKKFSFLHSYSYMKADGFQQLYFADNINHDTLYNEYNYSLKILQYYFAPTFYGRENNSFTLFGNIMYLTSNKYDYKFLRTAPIPLPLPTNPPPPVYIYEMPIKLKTITSLQFVAGINYTKNYKKSLFDFTATFSNINSYKQIQLTPGYGIYLNKNKTVFSKSTFTIFFQNPEIRAIINQSFSFKITKKLEMDISGSYGTLRNYNENNGYTILNSNDETLYRIGTKISFPIIKKLSCFASYSFSGKNLPFDFLYFNGPQLSHGGQSVTGNTFTTTIQNNKYNQHLINGGIIWKF
jgi:hypothetical protein